MNRRPTALRHGARACMLLATALFCAMPLLASAAPPIAKPLLPSMGEQRSFNLRIGPASLGRTFAIRSADASFVKVHFDHVSLPDGVTLEVSNPAGTEVYRYSNQKRDGYTYDASLGHDGRSSFSAMSIHGPVALVRLVGTPRGGWRATDGVHVSRYMRGHSEQKMQELRSAAQRGLLPGSRAIIGTSQQRPVACYETSDPVAFERARPVAHLMPVGCTAWRAGPGNHMFTNNHCLSTAERTAASELWFNNQASTCTGTTATPTKVPADQMLKTDRTLDYTLFTVKNVSAISSFGYLELEKRAPVLNEEIFIAGHPNWRLKELSVESDQDGGGRCKINILGTGNFSNYYCDTEGGNSGSPVIARASNKVIALHYAGSASYNFGKKMSLIWPQVSSFFGSKIRNDFNSDGKSDIVLWNPSLSYLAYWIMNGSVFTSSSGFGLASGYGPAPTGFTAQISRASLLARNNTSQELSAYLWNGTAHVQNIVGGAPVGWNAIGQGDINGDGKDDLLWRNPTTGQFAYWLMNDAVFLSGQTYSPPATYVVAGIADFNGDGRDDLLWNDPGTRNASVWLSTGTGFTVTMIGQYGTTWNMVGTADVTGDGKADIILRDNDKVYLAYWRMDGAVYHGAAAYGMSSDREFFTNGDFNGDGFGDLVITRASDRMLWLWSSNGTAFTQANIGQYGADWSIIP